MPLGKQVERKMEKMSRNSGRLSQDSGNAECPLKDCENERDFDFLVEKKIEGRSSSKGDQITSSYLCRSPGFSSSRPSVKPSTSSSTPPFSGVSTGISSLSCSSSFSPSPSPSSSLSSSTSSVSPPFSFPSTSSSSASSPLSFSPVAGAALKTPADRLQPSTQGESSPSMRASAVRESRHTTDSLSRPTSPSLATTAGAVHTPSHCQENGENFSSSSRSRPPLPQLSVHSLRKSSGEARSSSSVAVSPFSFGCSSSTSPVSLEPHSTSVRPSISTPSHGQKSPQSHVPKREHTQTFQFLSASLDPSYAFSSFDTSPSSLSSVSSTATFTSSLTAHPPRPREEHQSYFSKEVYDVSSPKDQREEYLAERNFFPRSEVLLPGEKVLLGAQGRTNREGREDVSLVNQHDERERGREKEAEEERQSREIEGGVGAEPKQGEQGQKGNLHGLNSSSNRDTRSSTLYTGEGVMRPNTPRLPTLSSAPCSSSFTYGVEDRTYARCQYTPTRVAATSPVVLPRPSHSSSSSSLLLAPSPLNPLLSGSRKTSSLASTTGAGGSVPAPSGAVQQKGKISSRDDRTSAQLVSDSSIQDTTAGQDIIASSLAARAAAEASSRAAEALLGRLRETERVHNNTRTTHQQDVRRMGVSSNSVVDNTKATVEGSTQSTSSVVLSVNDSSSLSLSPSCRVPESSRGYFTSSSLSPGKTSASLGVSSRLLDSSSSSSSSGEALPDILSQPFHHPTPQQRTTSGLSDQILEEKAMGTDNRVKKNQEEEEEAKEQRSEDEASHSVSSDESLHEVKGHRGKAREEKRWGSGRTSPVLDREDKGKGSRWCVFPSKDSTAGDEGRKQVRTLNEEATTTAVCQAPGYETSSSYSIKASSSLSSSSSSSSSSSPSPPSPSVCSESVISEEDTTCMEEESPVSTRHRPALQTKSSNNNNINWGFLTLASSSSNSSGTSSANHVFASSSSSCPSDYSSLAFHTIRRNTALRPLPRVFLNGNRATASFWISSCLLEEHMKQSERDCPGGKKEERPREGKSSFAIEQEEQRLYAKDWLPPGLRDFAEVLREQLEEEEDDDNEEEEGEPALRELLDEISSLEREGMSTERERLLHLVEEDVRREEEETEPRHDGDILRSHETAGIGNTKQNVKKKSKKRKQEKTREYIPSLSDGLESLEDLIQHCKQRAFKFLHASLVAGDVTTSSSFLGGTPSFSSYFSQVETTRFLGEGRRQEQDHQARQGEEASDLWGVVGDTHLSYNEDSIDRETERRRSRREVHPESSLSPLPTLLDHRNPCEDFWEETREKEDREEKREKDEEEVDKEGMKRSFLRCGANSDVSRRDGSAVNGFHSEMRGYAEDVLLEDDKKDHGHPSSLVHMKAARRQQQDGGKNQETGDGTIKGDRSRHGDRCSLLQRCQRGSEEGMMGNGCFLGRDRGDGSARDEEGGFLQERQQQPHTLGEEQEKEGEQGIGFTVQTMVDFYLSVAYLLGQLLKRDRAAKAFYKREVDLLRERLCLTTAQARESFTDAKRQLEEEEMQSRRLSKQVDEKEKRIQQILDEHDDLRRKFREEQRHLRLQQEAEIDDLNRQFDAIRKDLLRRDRQVERLQNELREAVYQNQQLQRKQPQLGPLSDSMLPLSRGPKNEQRANSCFRLSDAPGRAVGSESDDSGSGGLWGRRSLTVTGRFDKNPAGALCFLWCKHPAERPGSEKDHGNHIGHDEEKVSVVPKGQGNKYTGTREGIVQNRSTSGCLEDRDHRHRMSPSFRMEEGHSITPLERGGGLSRRKRIFHSAAVTPLGRADTRAVLPVRTTKGRTSSLDRFNRVQDAARYRQKSVRGRRRGGSRPAPLVDDRIAYQVSPLKRGRETANSHQGGLGWTTRTWNTDDETGAAMQQSGKFELLTGRNEDHFRVFRRWETTSQQSVGCEVCTNNVDPGAATESVDLGSYTGRRDFSLSREWSFSSVRSILSSGAREVGRLPDAWTRCTTPLFSLSPRNSRVQTLQEELLSVLSVGEREEAVRLLLRANVLQDICTLGEKDAEQVLSELALFTTANGMRHEAGGVDGRKGGVPEAQAVLAPYYCAAGSKSFSTSTREKRTVHARSYLSSTLGYASFFLSLFALDYAVLGGYCVSSVLKCVEWTSLLILSRTQELRHGFQHEDVGHPLAYVFQAIERFLLFFLQCLRGVAEPPEDEVLLSYTEMLADQFSGSSRVSDWEGSAGPGVFVSPRNEGFPFGAGLLGGGEGISDFCPREAPWCEHGHVQRCAK
ncbi:hypothetical protein CSUI_004930 [Cystoisospora suis]|uniref:Uncharacterized protein n=1 Tax=Cystoisospora suis TaxID=483139 RepID=A0A2C6K943_9APIC|nr:hypothetical protein CSUI_004930 [Cystoisospora suis]